MRIVYATGRLTATLGLAAGLLAAAPATQAQTTPQMSVADQVRQRAIDKGYPKMLEEMAAGHYDVARKMCQQYIDWQPQQGAHRYNMACIEARSGHPDLAFAALDKAVDYGFNDLANFDGDADLASLHADPRFAAVRKRLVADGTASADTPAAAPLVAAVQPVEPVISPGKLQGLFVTWTMPDDYAKTLRQRCGLYYFAGGQAYYGPTTTLDPAELNALPEANGTYTMTDGTLTINWHNQEPRAGALTPNGRLIDGYEWNSEYYVPVMPFTADFPLYGRYVYESVTGEEQPNNTNKGLVMSFSSDGTFSTARNSDPLVKAGTWKTDGYYLTTTDLNGQMQRGLCFPVEGMDLPRLFMEGIIFKRQSIYKPATKPAARPATRPATKAAPRKK